jgi:hypothetical protein
LIRSSAGLDVPAVLGLLPDMVVAKHLTETVRSGRGYPPAVVLGKAVMVLPESETRWHTQPVRDLLEEAMDRFDGRRAAADGWLAPRLHATMRMTRAEAADRRLWNHLATLVAPDYVVWRHAAGDKLIQTARFSGAHYTQTFSRLWWAAELFRNGSDYAPVEDACRVQDVLNAIMRLDVVDHRPTALAAVRVVTSWIGRGVDLSAYVNALSAAVNSAASTLVYDVLAPDVPFDDDAYARWVAESASSPPVPWDRLPEGPADGRVAERAIDVLVPLFEVLLHEAPKRQRARKTATDED